MNDGALGSRCHLFSDWLRFVSLMLIEMLVDEHLMPVELHFFGLKDWNYISVIIILF